MSTVVRVRRWTEQDALGTWDVLKEASFSNLKPCFQIAVSRPISIKAASFVALITGIIFRSFVAIVTSLVLFVCSIYVFTLLGTLYYLYGPTRSDMKKTRENYFRDEDDHLWVAEVKGLVVGTIGIVKKDCKEGEKIAWLRRMAVKKNYRRLGIAKKLVSIAITFCKDRKYDKIELITTEVHQPARTLYTRLGFEMTDYKPYKYLCGLVSVWTYEFEYRLKHT